MRHSFPARLLVPAALLAWAFLDPTLRAQETAVRTIPYEGLEIFSHILHNEQLRPLRSFEDAAKDPANSMVVLFGDPSGDAVRQFTSDGSLALFLKGGGSLLLATDYALELPDLSISVRDVRVNQKAADAYGKQRRCPFLKFSNPDPFGPQVISEHPIFLLLRKGIATNSPRLVAVRPGQESFRPLLAFPRDIQLQASRKGPVGPRFGGFLAYYMAGSPKDAPPSGRALFIAGHGMFINGMMAQKDNDNFDFATNAVRWLSEGVKDRRRTQALFVLDGKVVTKFDMKLTPPLPPVPIPTIKMLNRLVRGLEDERFFHRAVGGFFGPDFPRMVAVALALATFSLLLFGTKKLMENRVHVEAGAPSMVGAAAAPDPAAPIAERGEARLRRGDFGPQARQLVLDWLLAEFEVAPERWHAEMNAEFVVRSGFWPPWQLRRQAAWILALARTGDPTVSRHGFYRLVEALRNLNQALDENRLTLLVAGKNVRQD